MTTVVVNMNKIQKIGAAELELLRLAQQRAPLTIGDAAEQLEKTKGYTRTTVSTMMERLRKKGFLTRTKVRGVYAYSPELNPSSVVRTLIRDFVQKTLQGSVSPFVAYLVDEGELSQKELSELKDLVRDMEKKRHD